VKLGYTQGQDFENVLAYAAQKHRDWKDDGWQDEGFWENGAGGIC